MVELEKWMPPIAIMLTILTATFWCFKNFQKIDDRLDFIEYQLKEMKRDDRKNHHM